MRATGIVRRIDELGRVVVPKEIRKVLRIREGDPVEIFTDSEGGIVLKKYSHIGELSSFAGDYVQSLSAASGRVAVISDTDQIIAASGAGKKIVGKSISKKLEKAIKTREVVCAQSTDNDFIDIADVKEKEFSSEYITPVISNGDAVGSVILLGKDSDSFFSEGQIKLVQCASDFIGRYLEG